MTAANLQRKVSRPAYSPPQSARRSADVIALDFTRKPQTNGTLPLKINEHERRYQVLVAAGQWATRKAQ